MCGLVSFPAGDIAPGGTGGWLGVRELLQDGKYGYLVPMHTTEALVKGILQALDQPIPASGLAEAVRPFNEDVVNNRHCEVLGLCQK